MRHANTRVSVPLTLGLVALLTAGPVAPAVSAISTKATDVRAERLDAVGSGGVAINGSAAATASATVTVSVPAPMDAFGTLRLSNDGGTSWLERAWTTSLSWSLIDPAAGGIDADGPKSVLVHGGDGLGTWRSIGTASILLDRTGPVVSVPDFSDSDRVVSGLHLDATDAGVGLARTEVSLDRIHWRSLDPSPFSFYGPVVDLREGTIGGSWEAGAHTVYTRAVDKLGNVTESPPATVTPTSMRMANDPPATFEFPLPAVAGQSFTIKPVFDAGFQVPAGMFCQWRLLWGSEPVRLEAAYDPTYGEVLFSVSPNASGVCAPWTFTLPYTPPLEYSWMLSINSDTNVTEYMTTALAGSFRAAPGTTTSRAITSSSLPLYYVLPDRDFVGLDGTVTYRLYAAGGAVLPSSGTRWWSCWAADRTPSTAQHDQFGGSVFVCPVTTSEPWTAFWSYEAGNRMWRAGYDPVGDRSRPTITTIRVAPAPDSWLTRSTNVRVSWAGRDSGSGLRRYTLQVSRNGGAWSTITLVSRLTTALNRAVTLGSSYRFRVRATDRAGNTGAWAYSGLFRPTKYDDTTTAATWSAGWSRLASSGSVGGSIRTTALGGRTATFKLTGLGVGILAARGPDQGFAQVYVDGVLSATVNLWSASPVPPRVVWAKSWAARGTHTVRIRTLATVGRPKVSVDAFVVLR